jgi:excisionase family DNA binding protein
MDRRSLVAKASVYHVEELPLMLTVGDLQRVLGVAKPVAYALVHQEDFPAIRIGRSIRIPRDAFLKWAAQQAGDHQSH